jgi:hypothetical protein
MGRFFHLSPAITTNSKLGNYEECRLEKLTYARVIPWFNPPVLSTISQLQKKTDFVYTAFLVIGISLKYRSDCAGWSYEI